MTLRHAFTTSTAVVAALALLVLAHICARQAGPIRVVDDSLDRAGVAMFTLAPRDAGPSRVAAALLVHGYQCNHSMMAPLGRALTARGVRVFLLDLPGHGASPATYADPSATRAAAEAVEFVIRHTGLPRDRVALVGHSYGAMVLTRVIADHPEHPSIFIGPGYREGLAESAPRDLTIVTAANDYDFVIDAARRLASDATRGALSAPGSSAAGEVRREWVVVPEVGHVGLVFDARTHAAVSRAVAPAEPIAVAGSSTHERWALIALVLGSVALALFVAARRRERKRYARDLEVTWLQFALVVAYAAAVAALVVRVYVPLSVLALEEGEVIASFIFVAGVLAVVAGRLAFRTWPLPTRAAAAGGLPGALIALAAVYVSASATVSPAAYWVTFDGTSSRLAAAVVMAVAFYPCFAFGEVCAAAVSERRGKGVVGVAQELTCRLTLPLSAAASLSFLAFRLERFAPAMLAVGVLSACIAGILTRVSRNPAMGAIFASGACAWIIAVGFIRY